MSILRKILVVTSLILILSACGLNGPEENLSPDVSRGKGIYTQYCAACHDNLGDLIIVGPSLSHIASVAETRMSGMDGKAYIEESLLYPNAFLVEGYEDLMPNTFNTLLAEEELDSLIAYLQTLE